MAGSVSRLRKKPEKGHEAVVIRPIDDKQRPRRLRFADGFHRGGLTEPLPALSSVLFVEIREKLPI